MRSNVDLSARANVDSRARAVPVVAHLVRTYLWPSETFIHGQVVGDAAWASIVVARRTNAPERFDLGGRALLATTAGCSAWGARWADANYRVRRLTSGEARRTASALTARGVRLLHAHFGTDARFFRPLYRRLDVPLVVSFYGYDARKAPRQWLGLGRRYLAPVLTESARVLVPSHDMVADVVALGAESARVEVLPWGIDTARFAPVNQRARERGPVRFATACRFTEKKGVHVLLDAFARARKAGIDAELTIAGEGPLAARYLEQTRALRIADRVNFPGFVSTHDLPRFLAEQDVFVLASLTAADGDKEGTPTVLMEASAMSLPVVATRHGGIPDVIVDGEGGYLAPENDAAALAERLIQIARERDDWARIGARGRAHVLASFDATTQNRRREALYERVLAG